MVLHKIIKADELEKDIAVIREQQKGLQRYSMGLEGLDGAIDGGFLPGNLIVVSGPTGHGKTSLCRTMTKNMIDAGRKVLWFSYEETYDQLFAKMPSLEFYVPEQLETGMVDWIKEMILKAKNEGKCDIVFIDNLDFLSDDKKTESNINFSAYIGGVVKSLKAFAVAQGITIVLMAHIRKNGWSTNQLPTDEDIRDSGQIPQLADFIIFIIRLRDKNGEDIYTNRACIGISKNRYNGKTAKITALYDEIGKVFRQDTDEVATAKRFDSFF